METVRLGYELNSDDTAFNVRRVSDKFTLNFRRFDTEEEARDYAERVISYVQKEYREIPELEIVEEDCSKPSVKKLPRLDFGNEKFDDDELECEWDWTEDDCLPRY